MKAIKFLGILAILVLLDGWHISRLLADESVNRASGETALAPIPPAVALTKANKGKLKCNAAINTDGTVAACFKCNPAQTSKLATGQYQVDFTGGPCNLATADSGTARWVQPDTLGGGQLTAFCTTADRSLVPSAVFVQCTDAAGAFLDTSFFLFVAK